MTGGWREHGSRAKWEPRPEPEDPAPHRPETPALAYSAINSLLRKPMRFPGAQQLGWIQTTGGTSQYNHTSLPDYLDLARENRTFEAIIVEARVPLSMAADGAAEQVWSLVVSANYLDAMRAQPLIGRTLTAADGRGSDLAIVVGERFCRRGKGLNRVREGALC